MSGQSIDFSIVLPAYNDVELFQRALESVRCQRDVAIEIIVVDDSSRNDDIEKYVAELNDPCVNYYHNRPSLGAVKNWNSGLRLCHGDNVMIIHHDEALADSAFLKTVKEKLTDNDVVVCNIEVHHDNGNVYGLYPSWIKKIAIHFPSILFAINAFGPCAVIAARRNVAQSFDEKTNWFVDVEWYYRIMKGNRVTYIPNAIVASHHGHKGQITNNIDTIAVAKKDAVWLKQKYSNRLSIRFAMWFQINILHNVTLHVALKKIVGR